MKTPSCVNLCNVFTVRQSNRQTFVSTLTHDQMTRVCHALAIACDCD